MELQKEKTRAPQKLPVSDLLGLTAFQILHKNNPEFILQGSRVTALFQADERFYSLSERFNGGEAVNVQEFLSIQRQIKGILLTRGKWALR